MQAVKRFIKKNFGQWVYSRQCNPIQKNNIESWVEQLQQKPIENLSDASFDVFTYHGEDGILFYLANKLPNVSPTFIDIGAGDCIKSNCANLAVHHGWQGVFIDKSSEQLAVGKSFFKHQINKGADIRFIQTEVTRENVNRLMTGNLINNKVGILSIDIDGNDFWIWKAIEQVQPEIVVIEAKVEFGLKSIAVPYGNHNHHSVDSKYNGASVEALRQLGLTKGYKLVGANKQGYNLFFVKQNSPLPEVATASVLDNEETSSSFYSEIFFASHKFEIV